MPPPSNANAISLARKPNYDRLLKEFPNTLIHTSGRYVGLPNGQMGNSEVGQLNIGAGRIVYMDITKIDLMIQKGDFFSNPVLLEGMKNARSGGRRLHLCGLLSDGGVHSHQNICTRSCAWPNRTAWTASSSTASWMAAQRQLIET